MNPLALLETLTGPVAGLIGKFVTREEDRQLAQAELERVKNALSVKILEFQADTAKLNAQNISAEAQGNSWLQRNWRPLTMLVFLFLVVADSFGWLTFRLSAQAWELLQIGLGGYVGGGSLEKLWGRA
ncbi:MAG: holin family protein [Deltaproteobacteria bacterium]|nr:holin family protein [Deltaproteobacteria bacterium]